MNDSFRAWVLHEISIISLTILEDVYEQLSLLADIEISEQQEQNGQTLTQSEVEIQLKEWLR